MKILKLLSVMIISILTLSTCASAANYYVHISADKQAGWAPLSMNFKSTTNIPSPTYYWTFIRNDGTKDNSDWNSKHAVTATHTFKSAGEWVVTLKVTDKNGKCENAYYYVDVYSADFKANKTSIPKKTPITFSYTGNGNPSSYVWDFGDGIKSKNAVTATHTYTKPGKYTVKLTVKNTYGSKTVTKSSYITVR